MQTVMRADALNFLAQPPEDDRAGEGDNLGHQQRQQQAGAVQPQRRAVGGRHVDDRIDPVNVKEEGDEEEEDVPLVFQPDEGFPQPDKARFHRPRLPLDVVLLFVDFQERERAAGPPGRDDDKGDHHRRPHRQPGDAGRQHH